MQQKEFEQLVARLEVYSREQPSTYRMRVALLAGLGYLFLFGVLVVVGLIVAAAIYIGRLNFVIIKVLLIPLGLAAVILRSMWIKFPAPEGHPLRYSDAPKLFDLVKEVRQAADGPKVHKVLLTGDFNAGIVQNPRLGVLGWQKNYLLIGLPLLHGMSPADVRAVLAHEFGHLSGNHSRFAGWIYRVRQTWNQILENIRQNRRYGSGIFEKFFDWYAPYFAAYSFVLARAQEYEADRCSVELAGKEVTARMLINLELKNRVVAEDFLPDLYKQADNTIEPPGDAFTRMLHSLKQPVGHDKAQLWFTQSLLSSHGYDDTHPCLADRLAAIGYSEVKTKPDPSLFGTNGSANGGYENFLVQSPTELIDSRNSSWKERVEPQWQERYKFVREAEQLLAQLAAKAQTEQLNLDELWERARLTAGTKGYGQAIPFLREVLDVQSDHAAANYTLGEALLDAGDEQGIKHIEQAIAKDMSATPAGCELIYFFLIRKERNEEAQKYRERIYDYYNEAELAQKERENITTKDQFTPHGLPADTLANLREQLAAFPNLKIAYLVQKVVKHFPDEPSYVLGIVGKHPWYRHNRGPADQKLVDALATQVTYQVYTYIIALEQNYKPLKKKFKQVAGAEIFRRK